MKKYFVGFILFALGATLGIIVYISYSAFDLEEHKSRLRKINSITVWSLEYKEALDQANNPNDDIAVYALERALRILKSIKSPELYDGNLDCRITSSKYAELHMKLSKLYAKKDEPTKESEQLNYALAEYKKFGWIFEDAEQLKKAYKLIEISQGLKAIKRYGRSTKPACNAN